MFAFDNLDTDMIFIQNLGTIRAEVDPARIRVFGDDVMRRSDKPPAVLGVKPGCGIIKEVDVVSFDFHFHNRPGRNSFGGNKFFSGQLHPFPCHVRHAQGSRHSQGNGKFFRGGKCAGDYGHVIIFNVFKQ